eukprot:512259-Prymnesium_polylepis.1
MPNATQSPSALAPDMPECAVSRLIRPASGRRRVPGGVHGGSRESRILRGGSLSQVKGRLG